MNKVQSDECYNRIVEECKTFKTTFKDPDFLPNKNSIGKMRNNRNPVGEIADLIIWLRPGQINTEEEKEEDQWSVMNNPELTDVVHSQLVDDFGLMSPLAAVVDRPDILDNIFPSKEVSPYGVYRVKLFLNGEWQYIIVDDYIPCFVETSKIAVGFAKRKQLWVSLIEKALAKTLGSYSELWGIFDMKTAFSWLTGAVGINHNVPKNPYDVYEFWILLMCSESAKSLMTCSTILDENIHTYLILDVNDGYQHRLIRLKNFSGDKKWNGKWSNDWEGWPKDMKKEILDKRRKDKLAFWIELDDFINMFQIVTICKTRPNRHEFRESLTIGLDSRTIRFTVTETCEAVFEAISREASPEKQEDIMMSIHQISTNLGIGEMIGRTYRSFSCLNSTDDLILDPGEYIIILFNLENQNHESITKNLVCYSTKPIFYEWVQQSTEMLKQALREMILMDGTLRISSLGVYIRDVRRDIRGTMIMIDNFLNNKYLHVTVDASKAGTYLFPRGSMKTTDVIPPKSYKIVSTFHRDKTKTKDYQSGTFHINIVVSSEKYISAECTCDPSIIDRRLSSYPSIDASDWVHSTESLRHEINQMDEDVRRSMNIL